LKTYRSLKAVKTIDSVGNFNCGSLSDKNCDRTVRKKELKVRIFISMADVKIKDEQSIGQQIILAEQISQAS